MGNFHKINVGSAELIGLQDTVAGMPPTAFFTDTEDSDWDSYRDDLDADGNIILNIGAWLIRSQGQTIRGVATGVGHLGTRPRSACRGDRPKATGRD